MARSREDRSTETKRQIVGAFRGLMREKPFYKITVDDISAAACITRRGFYYHFADKYQLVNWIFYSELVLARIDELERGDWPALVAIARYFEGDRALFGSLLKDVSQNAFGAYYSAVVGTIIHATMEPLAREIVPDCQSILDVASKMIVEMHRSLLIEWLLDEQEPPVEAYYAKVRDFYSLQTAATLRTFSMFPEASEGFSFLSIGPASRGFAAHVAEPSEEDRMRGLRERILAIPY